MQICWSGKRGGEGEEHGGGVQSHGLKKIGEEDKTLPEEIKLGVFYNGSRFNSAITSYCRSPSVPVASEVHA